MPIWVVEGLSHPGDMMFSKNINVCFACVGMLLWWSCQSPVVHNYGLLNHLNIFHRWMFKLNTKFDADSLFYLLSHFEYNGHTVHMLTQWCVLAPLTSTVKSSLFTHIHSSLLSLAARLHWCASHTWYINSGWTFLGQILLYKAGSVTILCFKFGGNCQ